MVKLTWWQQFIIGSAVSFLVLLASKITNQTELAAIQSTIDFLRKLLAGNVSIT